MSNKPSEYVNLLTFLEQYGHVNTTLENTLSLYRVQTILLSLQATEHEYLTPTKHIEMSGHPDEMVHQFMTYCPMIFKVVNGEQYILNVALQHIIPLIIPSDKVKSAMTTITTHITAPQIDAVTNERTITQSLYNTSIKMRLELESKLDKLNFYKLLSGFFAVTTVVASGAILYKEFLL